MASKLTKFLIELSQDPLKRQQFENDPETAMRAAGLSAADKGLVLARDASRIRARFGMKTLAHMTCIPKDATPRLEDIKKCLLGIQELLTQVQKLLAEVVIALAAYPEEEKKKTAKKKKK